MSAPDNAVSGMAMTAEQHADVRQKTHDVRNEERVCMRDPVVNRNLDCSDTRMQVMRICDQTPKAILKTSFPKYRTNSFHLLGTVFTFRVTLKQLSDDATGKIRHQLKRFFHYSVTPRVVK